MEQFEGDSSNYEIITRAIEAIPAHKEGLTCEIGLRRGYGSKVIMDALAKRVSPERTHVAIDPYGNIEYAPSEGVITRLDYTNTMRDETIGLCYKYAGALGVNFIFMNLTDEQFFNRYKDGVPIYKESEYILNKYIFAHLDGPHHLNLLINEFNWFNDRMYSGATLVIDDIDYFDIDALHNVIGATRKWHLLDYSRKKIAYQKN